MEIAALPTLTDVEAQRIETLGYMLAPDPKPGDTTVPALPDDLMRMIWAKIWQQDAACIIQRAVRAAIARANGVPWDLPPLVDLWWNRPDGYDSEEELALFFYVNDEHAEAEDVD